jgi:hypothetical protein
MKNVCWFKSFENDGDVVVTADDVACVRDTIYEDSCWDASGKTSVPRSELDGKPCTLIIGRGYDVYVKETVEEVVSLLWDASM